MDVKDTYGRRQTSWNNIGKKETRCIRISDKRARINRKHNEQSGSS
jgi:hypothetical protein